MFAAPGSLQGGESRGSRCNITGWVRVRTMAVQKGPLVDVNALLDWCSIEVHHVLHHLDGRVEPSKLLFEAGGGGALIQNTPPEVVGGSCIASSITIASLDIAS